MDDMPRIDSVATEGATRLVVSWRGGGTSTVELAGWLARPSPALAPLADASIFARAAVGAHGSMVTWDDGEGDLAIDAVHLRMIADDQGPFEGGEAAAWQAALGLSNAEAADLVGVVPSTWAAYKAGTRIPVTVARLCRATRRDPVILEAHLRPRTPGRPRKAP